MRDKDGNPIVALPEKKLDVVHLEFTKDERDIYDALYRNAKSKFLEYAEEGTVLQCVVTISLLVLRLTTLPVSPGMSRPSSRFLCASVKQSFTRRSFLSV